MSPYPVDVRVTKLEIKHRIGEGRVVFECYSLDGIRDRQPDKDVQRPKQDGDEQVQQDGADNR